MAISKIGSNATGFASGLDISDGDITVASGHGISFAATSDATDMSSELLDDYEEGTFTFGVNANTTVNSGSNVGKYTKIGNMVHVQAMMDMSGVSGTNLVSFNSLPFTAKANTSGAYDGNSFGTVSLYNVNFDDDANYTIGIIAAGSNQVIVYHIKDNANWNIMNNGELTSSAEIGLALTYIVA